MVNKFMVSNVLPWKPHLLMVMVQSTKVLFEGGRAKANGWVFYPDGLLMNITVEVGMADRKD